MLNAIWLGMILLSVVVGVIQGRLDNVVHAVTDSAKLGFEIALGLTGIMALWLGIMAIASESGLITRLARLLRPVMRPLFPDVPVDDPAMGSMIMNMAANMLGLGNAATPFGLQAMKELQRLNANAEQASDAMCTFLAINTSSIQLIPATAIAFLAANGALHPSSVIFSSLVATVASTVVGVTAVKQLAKLPAYRLKEVKSI
ncbi:nucleoside recognition domain-containing protein [Legionella spiritensis]|uniref:Spore maturation protein A n=1 Tax=Legionella spiritensis TaxID=452 RepID=A0A0W0Z8J8_LEGSP|nr:nucleoside recognition domain-containing protein [Legionella spiritensis]KTD65246.1 spore maturation protein A [Legionella spiritensis]SNV30315.1 spore maturation protein A [Legionella spiritensis]